MNELIHYIENAPKLDYDGFSTYKNGILVYKQAPIENITREKKAMYYGPTRKWLLLILEKDTVLGQHLKLVSDKNNEVICKFV